MPRPASQIPVETPIGQLVLETLDPLERLGYRDSTLLEYRSGWACSRSKGCSNPMVIRSFIRNFAVLPPPPTFLQPNAESRQ